MTDYSVGDTITLEKGNDRLVREVLAAPHPNERILQIEDGFGGRYSVDYALDCGFEITAVTPKPAPLPTEPGVYLDARGTVTYLEPDGRWLGVYRDPINPALIALPLSRAVPESEVAAKVTEAKRDVIDYIANSEWSPHTTLENLIRALRSNFGVTE